MGSDGALQRRYPKEVVDLRLAGGSDGLFNVTPADFIGRDDGPGHRYGLRAYEAVEQIDLLVIPDLMWALEHSIGFNKTTKNVEVVQDEMIAQCERTRDRFAILDVPDSRDHLRALNWRLMYDSAYAALYFPWIVVEHEGRTRTVPPSGHIAGAYARTDVESGVHRAPANVPLEGVLDVERVLQDADIGYLNGRGVNCLKYFPTRGVRIWGARTVSSDGSLKFINVRRILSAIIRSVSSNLQWVVFEPNHPRLWKSVTRNVSFFLRDLWRLGFFSGRVPEEAFYVKCDHETNPAELRDAGYLVLEVGVAPVRPAEFIVFRVQQAVEEVGPGGGGTEE
jgi:phage tail sheath protein FI